MKKLIALVLALVCVIGLVACGGNVKNVKITDYSSEICKRKTYWRLVVGSSV